MLPSGRFFASTCGVLPSNLGPPPHPAVPSMPSDTARMNRDRWLIAVLTSSGVAWQEQEAGAEAALPVEAPPHPAEAHPHPAEAPREERLVQRTARRSAWRR